MPVAIAVRCRFFARLREQAGTETETVEVPPGSTADVVYEALRRSHPALEPNRDAVRVAVNQEFSDWGTTVAEGDELAFIPPVSGGTHRVGVLFELGSLPFDARRLEAAVAHPGAGAICTFTGVVRDNSRGHSVTELDYEAYTEMATAQMRRIADEIGEKWPEARVAMIHRAATSTHQPAPCLSELGRPRRQSCWRFGKWRFSAWSNERWKDPAAPVDRPHQ